MVDLSILEEIKEVGHDKDHQEDKDTNEQIELTGLEREFKDREEVRAYLFKMADNIKKSERLRVKINKAFINGDPLNEILIDCIECISLMTGDVVFYKQNKGYLEKMTS